MRKLLAIVLLSSCTATEVKYDDKYDTLLTKVQESQKVMDKSLEKAAKKEQLIINKTVASIIEDKKQIEQLKDEVLETKGKVEIRIQTIRDTVFITEKKNFWGKSKTDTVQ
jgi:hypothetical protein